jgi:hypothetical protein
VSDSHDPESARTEEVRPTPGGTDSTDDTARRVAELERRVTELEATTQALRGYVGGVRDLDREVERRANAALAAVDRLEAERNGATDAEEADRESTREETETGERIADRLRDVL